MERGSYRFELGQTIMGDNGEYKVVKCEKRRDATKKTRQRRWYDGEGRKMRFIPKCKYVCFKVQNLHFGGEKLKEKNWSKGQRFQNWK